MNNSHALEETHTETLPQSSSHWFAQFGVGVPIDQTNFACQLVAGEGRSRKLYLRNEIGSGSPDFVEGAGCGVIFDGVLFNRKELQDELGAFCSPGRSNDAEIILTAYQRWGDDLLKRLRGSFALVIWDSSLEILLCLRDPLGSHPLFYSEGRDGLLISPTIDLLRRQPGVSNAINRAALADHLLDRYPRLEETFFEAVRRVPPGHVLRATADAVRSYRYWDPAPDGVTKWLTTDEVEGFDGLFDQAVSRCLSFGPAGIFLSGGLDSVSVAAMAADHSRAEASPKPLALSLVFPDPEADEEIVQRSVAAQLGLSQVIKPFFEATGTKGLLTPALEMNRYLAAPLMNTWWPAYYNLACEGRRRGCQVIITGSGGDEWLTISPFLAADLWRTFDLAGVYKLWQSLRRSNRRSGAVMLWSLLWRFGAQPALVPPAYRLLKQMAPWAPKVRHRMFPRLPKWLAPDAALRQELDQRWAEYGAKKQQASDSSAYIQQMRRALDHPLISWELEELFTVGQRAGVRFFQPFWDADLIELLYRTPPFLLNRNDRSKGLVRASVARRFPHLGFDQQRKMEASRFYSSLVYNEGGNLLQQLGGVGTLADLGIIDEQGVRPVLDELLATRQRGSAYRIWAVLNLESWARAHA